jgi:hypothetical protein
MAQPALYDERRLTDDEVGRLHVAARQRGSVTFGWWLERICPIPGERLRMVISRGDTRGVGATVRAIFIDAGVLPRGSGV